MSYIVFAVLWAMLNTAVTALRKHRSQIGRVFVLNLIFAPIAFIWTLTEFRRGVFDVFGDGIKTMPDEIHQIRS